MSGGFGSRYSGKTAPAARQRSGGFGSGFTGSGTSTPPPKKKGGHHGILGAIGGAAHFAADKTMRAAHDVKSIPGGLVQLSTLEAKAINQSVRHPWVSGTHDPNYVGNTKAGRELDAAIKGMGHGVVESLKHPARDPFMTALNVLPAVSGAGRLANVGRTGELSSLTRPFEPPPRLIRSGDTQVSLHASRNPAVRGVQALYDKALQHGIDSNPEGRLGAHANTRVSHSIAESERYRQRLQEVPANLLEASAKKLGRQEHVPKKLQQAALRLTSENSTPREAERFHMNQAADGVSPRRNRSLAKLYAKIDELELVKQDATGNVVVNADRYPHLARVDEQVAKGQHQVDTIAAEHGVMSPEGLQARINDPARIRFGGKYNPPTPAKLGVPSTTLVQHRAYVDRLSGLHERATGKAQEGHFSQDQKRLIDAGGKLPQGVETTITRPRTLEEARTHLAAIDKRYEDFVGKFYEQKLTPDEMATQREINQSRGKYRKQQAGSNKSYHGTHKVQRLAKNVAEQKRLEAEQELHAIAEKNQHLPAAQAFLKLSTARDELRQAIGAHEEASAFGGAPSTEPLGGVTRKVREPAVHPLAMPLPSGKVVTGQGRILAPAGAARAERLGAALSVARDKLQRMEARAAGQVEPTGVVGGAGAREGRGYVSYRTVEPKAPRNRAAASAGPVVGLAKPFINGKVFTGHGLEHGLVPDNTTGLVARHMRAAYRYVNTDRFRNEVLKTGSNQRRTSRDVLVRDPGIKTPGKIGPATDVALGRAISTTDELAGHEAAFSEWLQTLVPGLRDKFALDSAQQIGSEAPKGYRWVDRNVLGDLARLPAGPRGRIASKVDTVNSAVTAATVYFKIGHLGTRALTNAATNIIQGSASPGELGKSAELWQQLSHEDRLRALAAAGQHGFEAMPHEGSNFVGRTATTGAHWWAKHIDAPFRFNSLAYEARRAGYKTPDEFRAMLDRMQNPAGLHPRERARIDGVAKSGNREGIAYDRLSDFERRYLTRAVWFYPWVRGTTGFAFNTLAEHPYKSAILGNEGSQGRQLQQRQLGDVPSYEGGLFQLVAHGNRPLVSDFSTFSPFVTPADVAEATVRPGKLADYLNPVLSAAAHYGFSLDQNGQPTTKPVSAAAEALFSPTPEAQIVTAYARRHQDQSNRMFERTPWTALERALVGPGMPRRVNKTSAHKAAARERAGR